MTQIREISNFPPGYQPSAEVLPEYTPAIEYIGIVMVKNELLTPYANILNEKWNARVLELNSTQLNLYELHSTNVEQIVENEYSKLEPTDVHKSLDAKHSSKTDLQRNKQCTFSVFKGKSKDQRSETIGNEKISCLLNNFQNVTTEGILEDSSKPRIDSFKKLKGKLVASYTLQRSQIGSASDYTRKSFVLRLRLETEQMIIQTPNFKEFLNWYWRVSIGIKLSLILELRTDGYNTLSPQSSPSSRLRSRSLGNVSSPSATSEVDDIEMETLKRTFSDSDFPSLIETMSNYVEDDDVHSLQTFGENTSDLQNQYEYLQLILMSRCIRHLTVKDIWVGTSVVIYDRLPQIDGYVYNRKTSRIQPRKASQKKDAKSIDVRLVRQRHLSIYSEKMSKGKLHKTFGEEYLITASGLAHPC